MRKRGTSAVIGAASSEIPDLMPMSLLFTGHMVDKPDRQQQRFPSDLEAAARQRIAQAVTPHAGMEGIHGFASGARGGDILFHEVCRSADVPTTMILPFPPDMFVGTSVEGIPGSDWVARFWELWNSTAKEDRAILHLPVGDDAYAATNLELVKRAREHGTVHLIALWDGMGDDGPGGTADLIGRVDASDGDRDVFSPSSLRDED